MGAAAPCARPAVPPQMLEGILPDLAAGATDASSVEVVLPPPVNGESPLPQQRTEDEPGVEVAELPQELKAILKGSGS